MTAVDILYFDAAGDGGPGVVESLNNAGHAVDVEADAQRYASKVEAAAAEQADVLLVADLSRGDTAADVVARELSACRAWGKGRVICFLGPGQRPVGESVVELKQPVAPQTLLKMVGMLTGATLADGGAQRDAIRFGEYEVIQEIARGGMGTVFLAQRRNDIGFHRLHALKVMHPHLVEVPEFASMFLDEAALASRVHHGNVAAIVDLGLQGECPYIVMQYVEGCSFSALLRAHRGPAPPALVASITLDALDGLHAAHSLVDDEGASLGLVHRDVSPENVLVGADGIARIADFGIAKARNRITTTQRGVRKGKLQYLSPEQLRDEGNLDGRADVFAMGVLLWNALTGRRLFAAESPAGVMNNILNTEIPRPTSVEPSVPAALEHVCMRALQREREHRYMSARHMADALREATTKLGLSLSHATVGAWVTSVCGEELQLRRAAARGRRRTWGPPTAGRPRVSAGLAHPDLHSPSDISADTGGLPAMSRRLEHTELSRGPHEGRSKAGIAGGLVALLASIAGGVLIAAQCTAQPGPVERAPDNSGTHLLRAEPGAALAPANRPRSAGIVAPNVAPPPAPTAEPQQPAAAEPEPAERDGVAPQAGQQQAAAPEEPLSREPQPGSNKRTRKHARRKRRGSKRGDRPSVSSNPPAPPAPPPPSVAPTPRTRPSSAAPADPLKAGPEANPYKGC